MEIYEIGGLKDIPGKNTPSGSWTRFKFPLEKFPDMRQSFQRFFTEGIRIGRLVEIMDYVACTCAYRYAKEEPKDRKVTMVYLIIKYRELKIHLGYCFRVRNVHL